MKMKRTPTCLVILILFLIAGFFTTCGDSSKPMEKVTLRSETASLTKDEVMQVIEEKGFHCPGNKVKGAFRQNYEEATLQGIDVIIDHTTDLMWQKVQDETRFDWREVEAYVAQMNQEKLAGFADWRIPTVEELLSLMESSPKNGKYIDPLFETDILSTWSIDEVTDALAGAWFVDFTEGIAADGNRAAGLGHVRLVRTAKPIE